MQKTRSVVATIALLCVAGLCPGSPDAAAGGADSARGDRRQASMTVSLDETGRILVGPGRFERTVTITRPHARTGLLRLRWELRSFDQLVASGARVVAGSGMRRLRMAWPIPSWASGLSSKRMRYTPSVPGPPIMVPLMAWMLSRKFASVVLGTKVT